MTSALAVLGKYIPGETTTVFLASIALLSTTKDLPSFTPGSLSWLVNKWVIFGICTLLTPLYVYLAARAAWRLTHPEGTLTFVIPKWRMVAASLAFVIWGLAAPGMLAGTLGIVLASLGALLASPLLIFAEQAFGLDK